MLGGELKARQARLLKEQAERTDKSRRKTEAERLVKERQQRRIQEAEDQARLKRLEDTRQIELVSQPPPPPPGGVSRVEENPCPEVPRRQEMMTSGCASQHAETFVLFIPIAAAY